MFLYGEHNQLLRVEENEKMICAQSFKVTYMYK
jgi:hypothetical protein